MDRVADYSIRLRILKVGVEASLIVALVVADYSIRLRILKELTVTVSNPHAIGCRLLDPIADTERFGRGLREQTGAMLQTTRSDCGY